MHRFSSGGPSDAEWLSFSYKKLIALGCSNEIEVIYFSQLYVFPLFLLGSFGYSGISSGSIITSKGPTGSTPLTAGISNAATAISPIFLTMSGSFDVVVTSMLLKNPLSLTAMVISSSKPILGV